jgi:sentrin-specific protease 1
MLITKLIENCDETTINYEAVRRWSKIVPGKDLWNLSNIVFPINVTDQHWMMVVASMEEKRIRFYDSMGSTSSYKKYVHWVKLYLQEEYKDKHRQDLTGWPDGKYCQTPTQENGYDCGVFVCAFTEHILFDKPIEFTQKDIPRARNHIAFTLINENQPIALD